MRPCFPGAMTASNDIAVNLRRQFLLFLWRDKRIPPLVPLSCLADKMIHSRILCKSPRRTTRKGVAVAGTWRGLAWRSRVLRARTGFRVARGFASQLQCLSLDNGMAPTALRSSMSFHDVQRSALGRSGPRPPRP